MARDYVSPRVASWARRRRKERLPPARLARLPLPRAAAGLGDAGDDGGDGDGDAAEAVATWRGFIVGMLGNLGPLPVDRIHNTLRQFAAWGPFPYTTEVHELRALLAALHAQGVVRAREDNLYELPA